MRILTLHHRLAPFFESLQRHFCSAAIHTFAALFDEWVNTFDAFSANENDADVVVVVVVASAVMSVRFA